MLAYAWMRFRAPTLGSDSGNLVLEALVKSSRSSHDRLARHVESWVATQEPEVRDDMMRYMRKKTASPIVAALERVLDTLLWAYKLCVPVLILGKMSGGRGPERPRAREQETAVAVERSRKNDRGEDCFGETGTAANDSLAQSLASASPVEERRRRSRLASALLRAEEREGREGREGREDARRGLQQLRLDTSKLNETSSVGSPSSPDLIIQTPNLSYE